jgi:hypothetical protein
MGEWVQGGLLAHGCQWLEGGCCMPTLFLNPCPSGVVGSGAHGDCERLRQHAFWECAIAQAVRTQVQRGLGGV